MFSDQELTDLTNVVHGILAGLPVPFKPDDDKTCNGIQGGCPVKANTPTVFKTSLPIKSVYPSVSVHGYRILPFKLT